MLPLLPRMPTTSSLCRLIKLWWLTKGIIWLALLRFCSMLPPKKGCVIVWVTQNFGIMFWRRVLHWNNFSFVSKVWGWIVSSQSAESFYHPMPRKIQKVPDCLLWSGWPWRSLWSPCVLRGNYDSKAHHSHLTAGQFSKFFLYIYLFT